MLKERGIHAEREIGKETEIETFRKRERYQ